MTYQRCAGCASAIFPPRVRCPACGSGDVAERTSAGRGTVYSTTTLHTREGTRNVSLVDLDEGFRMMSTVLADDVAIGIAVQARDDDEGRVVFSPADG